MDGLEVGAALEAHDGVDGHLGKVGLVDHEDLGGEGGARDVGEVLAQLLRVRRVVELALVEHLQRHLARGAEALDDGHGVQLLVDELLRLAQQLARQHRHGRRAVAHLVVLNLGQVCGGAVGREHGPGRKWGEGEGGAWREARTYEDLGRRVIDVYALQDRGAVVGDGGPLATPHALQDLVLRTCSVGQHTCMRRHCSSHGATEVPRHCQVR